MRATVDKTGRVILPADILSQAGFEPGAEVEVRIRDGVIELLPSPLPVRLEQRGYLLVAMPDASVAPLTEEAVDAVRDSLLTDRIEPS